MKACVQGDDEDRYPKPEETVAACLEPGDALLFDGATFHGGGANVTEAERRKVYIFRLNYFPILD